MDEARLTYIVDRLRDAHREIETTKVRIGDEPSESDALRSLGRAQEAVSSALERLDRGYKDEAADYFGLAEFARTYPVERLYDAERELETTKVRIGDEPSESDALRSLGRAQAAVSSALERLDLYYGVVDFDLNSFLPDLDE